MEDLSNYEKLKGDSQKFYNSIGKIFSPVFQEDIYFNSEGFNHIVFKRSHSEKRAAVSNFKI